MTILRRPGIGEDHSSRVGYADGIGGSVGDRGDRDGRAGWHRRLMATLVAAWRGTRPLLIGVLPVALSGLILYRYFEMCTLMVVAVKGAVDKAVAKWPYGSRIASGKAGLVASLERLLAALRRGRLGKLSAVHKQVEVEGGRWNWAVPALAGASARLEVGAWEQPMGQYAVESNPKWTGARRSSRLWAVRRPLMRSENSRWR